MSAIGTYGFINAKVKAMRANLLVRSDYLEMLHTKDLRAMSQVFEKTPWSMLSTLMHAGRIDALEQSILDEEQYRLHKIRKFASKKIHPFLGALFLRYDGEFIKILLRFWQQQNDLPEFLMKPGCYTYRVHQMMQAENIQAFIQGLQGTPFYTPLSDVAFEYKPQQTFPLEFAIDYTVFSQISSVVGRMNKPDRTLAQKLIGLEIDIRNLGWLVRYKNYYHLSTADISNLLLPQGHRLTKEAMQKIHGEENLDEAVGLLMHGIHINLPDSMQTALTMEQMEQFFYYVLLMEAKKAFGAFPFAIGAILGYYYLIRIEARNIRTLVQAKSYQLSSDEAEGLLII